MNKKEDDGGDSPYVHLDKSSVVQESRLFNETPINPYRCCLVLSRLLFILHHGEVIGTKDATEVFFAVTKLFQSKDATLRRMVYLTIKELSSVADDVIIVTSSLTKDMTGREDAFRASAIRALCRITDGSMLQNIERYLKQAIVDRNPSVASSAIVSAYHLAKDNYEIVKRWQNEALEAVSGKHMMTQYHGLGLLYLLKSRDRLAVSKLVSSLMRGQLRSPYAHCLLIRLAVRVMADENDAQLERTLFDYLEGCLRHKSEIVIYEASRAICSMPGINAKELTSAISVLQLFLSSPKPTLRFAAVRTLNKVAMEHPLAVTTCNMDMEALITDPNRSIATLAITTLLKTGSKSSVDRLMKQISSFMSEISDEFKVVVIDAIKSLCLKFPSKQMVMMNFLAGVLRDEGGFTYKSSVVSAMISIIGDVSEARETGFSHLCEFIEDCEFTSLSTRILYRLGRDGPSTSNPSKYIRFIYNRLILENSTVRAAAVSALAKFGAQIESLRGSVIVLLSRCLHDSDDEVRDRATLALRVLVADDGGELAKKAIVSPSLLSLSGLECALLSYLKDPIAIASGPFQLSGVPIEVYDQSQAKKGTSDIAQDNGKAAIGSSSSSLQEIYSAQLAAVPELANLGPLLKSSKPVDLTEAETEYRVVCVKHIFPEHVVAAFECTNTLNDQLLENVYVSLDGEDFVIESIVNAPKLIFDQPSTTYVVLRGESADVVSSIFSCTLKFLVKDCDPNTFEPDDEEGYNDEYTLEDLEISTAEFVTPLCESDFSSAWEALGTENEIVDTFALTSMKSLESAIVTLIGFLGMFPCERSDRVPKESVTMHTLLLSGVFRGNAKVMACAKLVFDAAAGVTMNLSVRSSSPDASRIISAAVG